MQKDDRFYTFLLTHSSKKRIYIRRVEVSKKWLHTAAASVTASVCIATASIGIAMNSDKLQTAFNKAENAPIARMAAPPAEKSEVKTINYERPTLPNHLNLGGPSSPFQLTNVEEGEENEMEALLVNIERTSNPEYLPTMWAHSGKINNEYGFRRNPFGGRSYEFHPGMDIDGEKGDLVVAPANGTIVKAGWQGGYGNLIEIDHGNGLKTRYGHLSKIDIQVGDSVQRSQQIGMVGSTGRSTGPHLHYELRLNDKAINPRRFLPPEMPN